MQCLLYCSKNEHLLITFAYGSVFKCYSYLQSTFYKMKIPLATSEGLHS